MTPAEELRAAAVSLRCEHSFPVQPPHGSLARPGNCSHCGIPRGDHDLVADELREPLAALLDAEADLIETIPEAARAGVAAQAPVQRYLAVARTLNGPAAAPAAKGAER